MDGLGKCPKALRICPYCVGPEIQQGVLVPNPVIKNGNHYFDWIRTMECRHCRRKWFVCHLCSRIRNHILDNTMLRKHHRLYHDIEYVSKKGGKRGDTNPISPATSTIPVDSTLEDGEDGVAPPNPAVPPIPLPCPYETDIQANVETQNLFNEVSRSTDGSQEEEEEEDVVNPNEKEKEENYPAFPDDEGYESVHSELVPAIELGPEEIEESVFFYGRRP
jgi:hypothetical protein